MVEPIPRSWTWILLSALRLVAGFLFIAHGSPKLLGIPAPMAGGSVDLQSLIGVAGIIELTGGGLLLIGLLTRPVAFLLSGEMAAAYFLTHWPKSFWPLVNGGELAVLYCFLFLFFAAAGAGPLSADALVTAWLSRGRPRPLEHAHAMTRRL
jgi:putative oxidoreductase